MYTTFIGHGTLFVELKIDTFPIRIEIIITQTHIKNRTLSTVCSVKFYGSSVKNLSLLR